MILMVKIRNIIDNGEIISMECYVNGDLNQGFHLELDRNTFEIIKNTHNEIDIFVRRAQWKIEEYFEKGEPLPKAINVVWC